MWIFFPVTWKTFEILYISNYLGILVLPQLKVRKCCHRELCRLGVWPLASTCNLTPYHS